MSSSFMPQIKNIVFLMLENRSLDNVLGWLYQDSLLPHFYPPGSMPYYGGLTPGAFSNPSYDWKGAVQNYPVVPCPGGLGSDQDRVPAYDPHEEFRVDGNWNGVMNQLFGNQNRIGGLPVSGPQAPMLGFLQDYYSTYMVGWKGLDILWAYTPQQVPVINGLAQAYALSDAWCCSVPTQTNPNRAYSICGTSLGRESNSSISAVEQFDIPTFFDAIGSAGLTWGLYFTDVWQQGLSYTEYTFPQISKAPNGDRGDINRFLQLAAAGTLPAFTYLEPKWGFGKGAFFVQGTDYHPPTHVAPAELFLHQVYWALRNSPQWSQTLFIVTFDEHGGTYDHVAPPWGAINPDGMNGASGFKFDLFGARVPTLLISQYIKGGIVFRAPSDSPYPFDHTSFIKTFLLWAGVDPNSVNLGRRMPQAPTFEGVLSSWVVNDVAFESPQVISGLEGADVAAGPAGPGLPLNAIFEGMPFASVRAVLSASETLADIMEGIAKFKADPVAFERSLE
jgi:phospholipase C